MSIICTWKLCIICTPTNFVSYARKNCVLYARQTHVYQMNAKVHFCISIPWVFVFIWRSIYTHFHETGLKITQNNKITGLKIGLLDQQNPPNVVPTRQTQQSEQKMSNWQYCWKVLWVSQDALQIEYIMYIHKYIVVVSLFADFFDCCFVIIVSYYC